MTLAAKEIIQTDREIIEIAFMYGYNSPENFSRAFKKMWGVNPSEYRNNHQYVELFPMLSIEKHGTDSYDFHKDVTALYDYLTESADVKIICFDIVGLMRINDISRDAGDKAILEAVKRILSLKEDNQLLFRLGGDEFALLIRDRDLAYCFEIDEKINSMNGKCFKFGEQEIPLVIRVWISTKTVFESKHEMSEELIHKVKYAWEQTE